MDNSKLLKEINDELIEYIKSYKIEKYKNVKKLAHSNIFKKFVEKKKIQEKINKNQINRLKPEIDELLKKHQAQIKITFSKNLFKKTNNNNNNKNNLKGYYRFDEKYIAILQKGMKLYNSNNFNAAFPLLKEAADDGGIPLAATKVASYYIYASAYSLRNAINYTYSIRSSVDTNNSTPELKKKYKRTIAIAYLFLALARYTTKNEILCTINPELIKIALFNVFGLDDNAVKKEIKSIKESGWKRYVKESILDVIEEHNLLPTLMKKKKL
jgi:hypothetical protein